MALHLSGLKILLFPPFWHVYCFVKHGKPVLAACATWSHQNRSSVAPERCNVGFLPLNGAAHFAKINNIAAKYLQQATLNVNKHT
ncbi:hypothetical protein LO507_000845 [Salmonella enterica subsp. arizonae serovar 41:z4,z23:-]|nr:hypothetical protein [Salmonella enterica subsp. arizonae serovar 41:z4,z23:-]